MKILITGANGFIGTNLCIALENIRDGKDKSTKLSSDLTLYKCDVDTEPSLLDSYCKDTDFVYHLAGVNRPKDQSEFMAGNFGFTSTLLNALQKHGNTCPIMLSSSIQASLDNPYGKSKKAGENLVFAYSGDTGAKVFVYRFPNVFGKWCRPNYNSAVATFCYNIVNDLPVTVHDRSTVICLAYIDDVINEMVDLLSGLEHRDGVFCIVPVTHTVTLGEIIDLLDNFKVCRTRSSIPDVGETFTKKLYATYLSYLPGDQLNYPLRMNADWRGSFTEMLHIPDRGQVSVNISKPGIVKGNHWHNTKTERFIVVSGKGVIRFRKVGECQVYEYFVSSDKIEALDIPPGFTHNIENLGDTDMVTVMWASELFDPAKPDTYFLEV